MAKARSTSHRGEHSPLLEPPMTLILANGIWPREAIRTFAFEQPPRSDYKVIKRQIDKSKRALFCEPGLPAARDITVFPEGVHVKRRRFTAGGRAVKPLFIYPPDNRYAFTDTTYPWRCCGRVVTAAKQGSGCIVGPQHILTASHVVDWTISDNKIGWLRFEPDYNDGDVFDPSYAMITYSYEKISKASGEYDIAEDYVVCVMDRRIGDELGWLGTKTYDDGWDGEGFWAHVGYPGDIGSGSQPVFEGPFSIFNSWPPGYFEEGAGLDMETYASLTNGDSGGPIFGFWNDGPYAVGVVSAEGTLDPNITDPSSRTGNWVGGGHEMPDLVSQARTDHP